MTRHLIAIILTILAFSSVSEAQCESRHYNDVTALHLIPAVDQYFTVCYDPQFPQDAEFAKYWLNEALQIGIEKYGVTAPHYQGKPLKTVVFLAGQPTSASDAGYVVNRCCVDEGTEYVTEIHYLTPAAWPDWTSYGVCWINMTEYHAHYLVHEMMHTVQFGLWDRDVPNWIAEALAEYDAFFHTTQWNRVGGVNNLIELAYQSHADRIYYGVSLLNWRPTITVDNAYVGGATVMMFLAERFGEEIHSRLLETQLMDVLTQRDTHPWVSFWNLKNWLSGREELRTIERCSR